MRAGRTTAAIVATTAIGASMALLPATPAAAAVTATSSGTTVTVTMTGTGIAGFSCSTAAKVQVNLVDVAPALACSALTQVTVTGDAGPQIVRGADLLATAFSANPRLVATMGDGSDDVEETDRADQLDLGGGDDRLRLRAGGLVNTTATLSSGTGDVLYAVGTSTDDAITASSGGSTVTIAWTGGATSTASVTGADNLLLFGLEGDDALTTTGIALSSTIDISRLGGGEGDDVLRDGPSAADLSGDEGTNQLFGGGGSDRYISTGTADELTDASDGVADEAVDLSSGPSGAWKLTGFDAADRVRVQGPTSDSFVRIRPSTLGSELVTLTLGRTGQQRTPPDLAELSVTFTTAGTIDYRAVADVVAGDDPISVALPVEGTGLLDVTIPSGTWTVGGTAAAPQITSSFGTISASSVDDSRVHGPWTDRNLGFAHRATRDLLLRFGSNFELLAIDGALDDGTLTRAQLVAQAMGTDEYRGLDVDRVFEKYLGRNPDPGGRTYWIGSIAAGKALWRFRAQLFGSNEYFARAGGTNARYVQRAYQDVLGRAPDASGAAYWTNKLNAGADRGAVALQFMNSAEARRRLVDDQFLRFLDRRPTASEQTTWVAQIPTADGEQRLVAFLATSSAYYNRS